MQQGEARRLKELEIENARLKHLVANQAIDISILKEAMLRPHARWALMGDGAGGFYRAGAFHEMRPRE